MDKHSAADEDPNDKLKSAVEAVTGATEKLKVEATAASAARSKGFGLTDDAAEYKRVGATGQNIVLAPALHVPYAVRNLCNDLRLLADQANRVSELNSIAAYRELRAVRRKFQHITPRYQTQLADSLRRLAEPVEGAAGTDAAWIQGFTSAAGTSALLELHITYSSVSEALDRKSAYAMACFSLYISLTSLVVSFVLAR